MFGWLAPLNNLSSVRSNPSACCWMGENARAATGDGINLEVQKILADWLVRHAQKVRVLSDQTVGPSTTTSGISWSASVRLATPHLNAR